MSVKVLLLLLFVGLVAYALGRRSGKRAGGDGRPMLQPFAPRTLDASRLAGAHAVTLDAASLEQIKRLLHERQLIEAIRTYRERTNCGLREAKEAVELIEKSL
ncbi:MAG TPA: hypothetical protein VEY11_03480 [Pyrinomonadaceae bacterium]|nr:hypothetical protein [Pyrinomonadaceae bacterium]